MFTLCVSEAADTPHDSDSFGYSVIGGSTFNLLSIAPKGKVTFYTDEGPLTHLLAFITTDSVRMDKAGRECHFYDSYFSPSCLLTILTGQFYSCNNGRLCTLYDFPSRYLLDRVQWNSLRQIISGRDTVDGAVQLWLTMRTHYLNTVHAFLHEKHIINQCVAVLVILATTFRQNSTVLQYYAWTFENAALEKQWGVLPLQHWWSKCCAWVFGKSIIPGHRAMHWLIQHILLITICQISVTLCFIFMTWWDAYARPLWRFWLWFQMRTLQLRRFATFAGDYWADSAHTSLCYYYPIYGSGFPNIILPVKLLHTDDLVLKLGIGDGDLWFILFLNKFITNIDIFLIDKQWGSD